MCDSTFIFNLYFMKTNRGIKFVQYKNYIKDKLENRTKKIKDFLLIQITVGGRGGVMFS